MNENQPGARRGRSALVTGASSGIGEEFAKQLAAKGYDLVLVARSRDRLEALAESLGPAHGVSIEVLDADLTEPAGLERVEVRLGAEPGIDLLVNNAGFGAFGHFAETDPGEEKGQILLNVLALVALTHAALPGMIARKRGGVINVSSVAGFFPGPNSATYAATKAFVNSFTESISEEVRGTGVRVQALCPGFTKTNFQGRAGVERSRIPEAAWLESRDVVEESLEALNHGTLFCVPGIAYKAITMSSSLVPRPLIRWISGMYGRQVV